MELNFPFNSGHTWLKMNKSGVAASLFIVLKVGDKLIDTSRFSLVGLNLDKIRILILFHVIEFRFKDVSSRRATILTS